MFRYINTEKNKRFTCERATSAHTNIKGQNFDLFLQHQIRKTIHDSMSGSVTMWNVLFFGEHLVDGCFKIFSFPYTFP